MRYTRTKYANATAVELPKVKAFLRVDFNDDDLALNELTEAVELELEEYCGLALLDQTITATTDDWPLLPLLLPVGPVATDAAVVVEVIEQDGSTTPVTGGFWLEAGRYPRLHFTTTPAAPLRITYTAGCETATPNVPADLKQAVCEQVAAQYDGQHGSKARGLCAATARIAARHRRIAL